MESDESDEDRIECSCEHDICDKWKRDVGDIHCQNLLTLDCETGVDVTKDDWIRVLRLIFEEIQFLFYSRCFKYVETWSGHEYTWFFAVKFLNPNALSGAKRCLRTAVNNCFGYSKRKSGDFTEKFNMSGLNKGLFRSLRKIRYGHGSCLLNFISAVGEKDKTRYWFGDDKVKSVIKIGLKWYQQHILSLQVRSLLKKSSKKRIAEKGGKKVADKSHQTIETHVSEAARSRSHAIKTSFLSDASWTITSTELNTAITAEDTSTKSGVLVKEQVKEQAEILRLRLSLAGYKLFTGQATIPFSKLQQKPLPLTRKRILHEKRTNMHSLLQSADSIS